MPFDIEPYDGNAAVGRVRICLKDRLDCSEASAISQWCRRFTGRCRIFYLDLADMGEVSREILAWLRSYLRWGRDAGVSVRIVNAAAHHLSALSIAGISESGTAAFGEPVPRVAGAGDALRPAADAVISDLAVRPDIAAAAGAPRLAKVCDRAVAPACRKAGMRRPSQARRREARNPLRD